MKTFLSLLALLLLAASAFSQDVIHGKCVGCVDGDTLHVLTNGDRQFVRVRVAFIDCPEKGQVFGSRAKQALSELVFGKEVELRPHAIDRYGRLVCLVFVDGRDAGLELIKQGLAWAYTRYLPEASADIQQSYTAAEAAARAARVGLWTDPDAIPPWEWRHATRVK